MAATLKGIVPVFLLMAVLLAAMPQPPAVAEEAPVCALVGRCGDINASGTVSATDALLVLREAVGLDPGLVCQCEVAAPSVEFPVESPVVEPSGKYQLSAVFPDLADQTATWAMVSDPALGQVTEGGLYTAGATPGEDVVEVASVAEPSRKRQQTVRIVGSENTEIFWSNTNPAGVDNGGTPPQIPVSEPVSLHKITTYHWNYGSGTTEPGTIGLRRLEDDRTFGPWQAYGGPYQNLYWTVNLGGLELPVGTYEVLDSDPSTWAQNSGTGGAGMTWLERWIVP